MIDRNSLINDSETSMRTGLDGRQAQIWTALPCLVVSVNLTAMTIQAQPTIKGEVTNADGSSSFVNLPVLSDVPIVFPSAGGFTLSLPVLVGDEVLVVFSSRCIDAWWKLGGVQMAAEFRMHDLSDGFAIFGPKSQPNVVANISSSNAQLRSNDGSVFLEITPGGAINLTAPSGVTITGALNVNGAIIASGEVTGNAIPLSTHVHTSSTPGSPTSGPLA